MEKLKSSIEDLPINAALLNRCAKSLREAAFLKYTHYSTRIEGNLLTLREVVKVGAGQLVPGGERDEIEVCNHFIAIAHMETLSTRKAKLYGA